MKKIIIFIFIAVFMFLEFMASPPSAEAQPWGYGRRFGRGYEPPERDIFPSDCFTFCRVRYYSRGDERWGRGRRGGRDRRGGWGGRWDTDYPDSDLNFSQRLSELTSINVNRDEEGNIKHAVIDLTDDDLFHYPFIYMLEVAELEFREDEIKALRSYLLRGGFLMVDDFWGSEAWANWEYEIHRVLPEEEYPMVDIPMDHEIFHIVFEIDKIHQIPGIGFWYHTGGETSERWEDSETPHCKGIFDKNGRLMVVVNHNTDLGDGWEEEAQNPVYFREFSARKAYPLGINIVVYAMTH